MTSGGWSTKKAALLTKLVDAWGEGHGANRSEAMRRLVEFGLEAKR
jgi:hypothetical protein